MKFSVTRLPSRMGGGSYVTYYDERDKNRVYASAVIRGRVTEKHFDRLKRGIEAPTLPFQHRLAIGVPA